MDPNELPPDLAELERRLAGRPRPEPAAGLRPRVLAAVGRELGRRGGGSAWRFAAATAAAALLWINFSMSVANDMDWRLGRGLDGATLAAAAGRLRQLVPELPEREALRQALLLQAGSRLVPAPDLRPSADRIRLFSREHGKWDTP
jgi:hypothetical protein